VENFRLLGNLYILQLLGDLRKELDAGNAIMVTVISALG